MQYNLLEENWIRVVTQSDEYQKCSIKDIIQNAHLYKSLDIEEYNNIRFYPYEYLLLRFLSTLVARVLQTNTENIKKLLEKKQFDIRTFDEYFQKWHNRFDLFDDEYPFMQTDKKNFTEWPNYEKLKKDKKNKEENLLSVNPTSPAASGRLFYANISPETFCSNKKVQNDVYVLNDKDKNADIKNAVLKSLPITCEHWAYIVLYNNSLVPGVGSGNKCALAGNSGYWEIINGNNLYETLLLNAPNTVKISRGNANFIDTPLWELNNCFEILEIEAGTYGEIAGMFVPARIIRGTAENGIVTEVVYSSLKSEKNKYNYNEILDSTRQTWALTKEPHAVHKNIETLKDEKSNPYATLTLSGDTWLMLLGEVESPDTTFLKERLERFKIKTSYFAPTPNNIVKRADILDKCRLTIYYRICNGSKWTYQKIGKISGTLPREYFDRELVRKYILNMATFIRFSANELQSCVNQYIGIHSRNYSFDTNLINRLANIFGIYNNSGFIQELLSCNDEKCMADVYQKYIRKIISITSNMFDSIYKSNNVCNFWKLKNILIGKLYECGGLNNGNK